MKTYIKYNHHNVEVWVNKELKGKHRDHCLCFNCVKFNITDRDQNCRKANMLFAFCQLTNMTTPVYECVDFFPANNQCEHEEDNGIDESTFDMIKNLNN